MKIGSEPHQVIKFPVCPWSSFCYVFFLYGTSYPLRMKGGTEVARNSQPPSSLPPLHDGHLGRVSSPEVLSPAILEFESRHVF